MRKLFEDLINEVARPRMPDEQKFVDAHKAEVNPAADARAVEGSTEGDAVSKVNKDRTRRADRAPGEDEAEYQKLQPDDKSAKAFAARAKTKAKANEEMYVGGALVEGVMAHGIFDKDPAKAKEARKKLKALLAKPLPAEGAADKIYPLFFADDLFDELDYHEKENTKDVRSTIESFLKKYKVTLGEGFVPSEFVPPTDLREYAEKTIGTASMVYANSRCGRYESVNSYRTQVSNVLSDMILARRTLTQLHSSLCWSIGRTDMGAEACAAMETIVTTHNALLQDLLAFEEEYCSQEFIRDVRADLGIEEIDLDDVLDDAEGEDQ